MKQYRYTLDPGSRKHRCPGCNQKTFVRMVDTSTGEYAPDEYGRCDREQRCGYHMVPTATREPRPNIIRVADGRAVIEFEYSPEIVTAIKKLKDRYFDPSSKLWQCPYEVNSDQLAALSTQYGFAVIEQEPRPEPFIIPFSDIERSCKLKSHFHTYLFNVLGEGKAAAVLAQYHVGLSNSKWPGATVFFSIDINQQPRRGKVMVFSPEIGKRQKDSEGRAYISSIHALLGKSDLKPDPCFFGEHLLSAFPDKPVAVVESEKTAILASAYLPGMLWLACDGSGGINAAKFRVLKGRQVVLFPDAGCADKWQQKADETGLPNIKISRILEDLNADEGSDIADYLATQQIRDNYPPNGTPPPPTDEFMHWRFINWAESLEHCYSPMNKNRFQAIINEVAAAGFDDIPDEIMQKHAPTVYKNLQLLP